MSKAAQMVYYRTDKDGYEEPIKYVFDLFSSVLGVSFVQIDNLLDLTEKDILINYSSQMIQTGCQAIRIVPSGFLGKSYLKPESLPELPLNRYNDLPIIYQGKNKIEEHVRKSKNLIETDIDIIASSFFMVTRYEEVILENRDKYGRFPATASLAYKENFLDRPIVNEYIELLWSWIDGFDLGLKCKKPWGNRDFVVCLTHDIDEIRRYKRPPFFSIIRAIKQKNVRRAVTIFFDYLETKIHLKQDIYYDTFDYIIDLEKKYGFKSSFYFMTNGERYSLSDPWVRKLIVRLQKEDFEIGIHPSSNAFNKPEVLSCEIAKLQNILGEKIIGGRQHYLKWEIPMSWRMWKTAGLRYDTTLAFADHEGFRCGICHPFRPFDVLRNEVIDLWEISPTVMDMTLAFHQPSLQAAQKTLETLLGVLGSYQGVFVLLWHNSYMTELFTPQWKECLERFYCSLAVKNCIVSSMEDLLTQWEKNNVSQRRAVQTEKLAEETNGCDNVNN